MCDCFECKRLDWVKVDVEGAELSVLRGLQASLSQFKPRLIVEVWDRTRCDVLGLMKAAGFEGLEVERLEGFDFMKHYGSVKKRIRLMFLLMYPG